MRLLSFAVLALSLSAFAQDEAQEARPAEQPAPAQVAPQPAPETPPNTAVVPAGTKVLLVRSEERRVGKECRL